MSREDATPILEVTDVSKRYGARQALQRVGFVLHRGELIGLLGPNGAGKTTALSILSSVLAPDAGRVTLDGGSVHAERALRRRIGLVPQSLAIYPTLSARQNVRHFGRMAGLSRTAAARAADEALAAVGLLDRSADAARALSGGLQRRLNLACGIVHRPDVLLLDEPTVGVDIESRESILALVHQLCDAGAAIVYSTHYMEEAERLCRRVLLLDRGTLVADDTVEALIARARNHPRMEITYRGRLSAAPLTVEGAREVAQLRGEGRLAFEMDSLALVPPVLDRLRAAGVSVVDFSLHSPNLSDAFLALTGRRVREPTAA